MGGAHAGFDWSAWLVSNDATAFNTPALVAASDVAAGADPAVALHAAVSSAAAEAEAAKEAEEAKAAQSPSSSNATTVATSPSSGRRRMLNVIPWTSSECVAALTATFAAGEHSAGFCSKLSEFASRSCFCHWQARDGWFSRKGREWVAFAAAGMARCEATAGRVSTAAICFPESAFCPAGVGSPAITLDLSVGHYWLMYDTPFDNDRGGGLHLVSATLPASAGGAVIGGGPIVHVARRPHVDATGGIIERYASTFSAGAATVTIRTATKYNWFSHAGGGDAFAIMPEVISAPKGASTSIAIAGSTVDEKMTTPYSSHGYGANA